MSRFQHPPQTTGNEANFSVEDRAAEWLQKHCVFQQLFCTLKKGYTPETSVLIDIFDTS